jgi:hypothetical protein
MNQALTVRFRSGSRRENELLAALRSMPRGGASRLITGILKEVFSECAVEELPAAMEELADYPARVYRSKQREPAVEPAVPVEPAAPPAATSNLIMWMGEG